MDIQKCAFCGSNGIYFKEDGEHFVECSEDNLPVDKCCPSMIVVKTFPNEKQAVGAWNVCQLIVSAGLWQSTNKFGVKIQDGSFVFEGFDDGE